MIKYRSLASVIILTIVTCGIYGLFWIYETLNELEQATGQSASGLDSTIILIIAIFIGPVGYLFYGMAADEQINLLKAQNGIPEEDNKVLYMILGFIFPIILIPIVQAELNKFTAQ